MILPTLYFVVTDFGSLGIGSAGDATDCLSTAYDQYAEAVQNGQPTRAFKIEFDVGSNALETAREITDDLRAELERICEQRGLDVPEAA